MANRTLAQIIEQYRPSHGVTRTAYAAIAAAYWAGQEQMRGQIVAGLERRAAAYQPGRYYNVARRAMRALLADGLLGGQGRNDAPEILSWDFEA